MRERCKVSTGTNGSFFWNVRQAGGCERIGTSYLKSTYIIVVILALSVMPTPLPQQPSITLWHKHLGKHNFLNTTHVLETQLSCYGKKKRGRDGERKRKRNEGRKEGGAVRMKGYHSTPQ
jgi:hypothetical protein